MEARTDWGGDRVAAGEVEVDLREALASPTHTPPNQTPPTQTPAGQTPPAQAQPAQTTPAQPPAGPTPSARPVPPAHSAPGQSPPGTQPQPAASAGGQPAEAPAGPEPAAEPDASLPIELLPDEIYRIADGEDADSGARKGLSGRLRNLLTSPPAKREEELDKQLRQLRVRGLARGVTVAFGSIKGGVGKTTLTLSMADTLADALRCGVVVVDADLEWGTAADSTPQEGRRGGTITDVLRERERINSPGDLAPFLTSLPGGAQLLAGPTDPTEIEGLHAEDMSHLLELLRRFFPVILLDLSPGIGLRGTIPRWAFSSSDEIVAIATPTRASLRRAARMLGHLAEHHGDVPVTLALNMVPHRPDEAIRRVIEVAQKGAGKRRYAAIPADPALTRQLDAGVLNLRELGQPTRIAIKDLCVQLASPWCR